MNEIAANQLASRRKDAKKSSMASRMGPETEKMFTILSSRDWDEQRPRLNSFMTRLMEDKGMSQACELVRSELRHGEGVVTENGLIQFLSNGYICLTMEDRPGGFTFFMFRPHYIAGGHNSKLVEQSIRETFGDVKLMDEEVKYYARMNFFLPASFEDFMIQLETCYQTLELFTNRKGIASAGYRLAFKIIAENKKWCRPLFDTDLSLGVKIGRFLDNLFQNFCSDLSEQIFADDPIKTTRRRLEYRFEDQVRSFFNEIRNGDVPFILLPASLTPTSSVTGTTEDSGRGESMKDSKKSKSNGKQEVNPEIQTGWRIPPGKKFGDFFSSS
jgi:hypothetical protein